MARPILCLRLTERQATACSLPTASPLRPRMPLAKTDIKAVRRAPYLQPPVVQTLESGEETGGGSEWEKVNALTILQVHLALPICPTPT